MITIIGMIQDIITPVIILDGHTMEDIFIHPGNLMADGMLLFIHRIKIRL